MLVNLIHNEFSESYNAANNDKVLFHFKSYESEDATIISLTGTHHNSDDTD